MVNLINIKDNKDLITIDLRTKQIRFIKDVDEQGPIEFINLSRDDVAGYEYLWKNAKPEFYKTVSEDLKSFIGADVNLKDVRCTEKGDIFNCENKI